MALTPGTRLGVYEIATQIGAGGMGEVYRATDGNLKRSVAIKVLPASVAGDADRLARFQREAEVLAALNHPNIGAIYGLEKTPDFTALVMELVEGDDLSQRIARSPIPLDEALAIARQMTEALEAAHDRGIVHRDLKPANIRITADGKVKVLDFGLAKAMDAGGAVSGTGPAGLSLSPTLSVHATYAGVILGTAAYMSPEQARGKPVDRRTDIWAFGCVLFEMLTGRQTFDPGETVSDAVAAVLKNDPDWSALPADTPPHIRTLLRRCLQKDPKKRLPHIGIARIEIDEGPGDTIPFAPATALPTAPARPLWKRALPVVLTALLAIPLTGAAAWVLRPSAARPKVTRFPIALPDDQPLGPTAPSAIAIAPDGSALLTAIAGDLRLRRMADMEAKSILSGDNAVTPFFSPNGQWLGYVSLRERALKKIAITGGASLTIRNEDSVMYGPTWVDDHIYYAQAEKGILRVPADGGESEVVVPLKAPEVADSPQVLDHGKAILFTLATESGPDRWDKAQVVVQPLPSGARRVILRGGHNARYVGSGHLLFVHQGTLLAAPFDLKTLQTRGGPVPVVDGLMGASNPASRSGQENVAVSESGTLVYVPGAAVAANPPQLHVFDRTGKAETLPLPPARYSHPRFSPDGRQLVYATNEEDDAIVWVHDLGSGSPPRRLTFTGRNSLPIWTPDGRRITFRSARGADDSGIYWQAADGTGVAERLIKADAGLEFRPEAWTPDGKTLAFLDTRNNGDIFTLTLGSDQVSKPLVQTPINERYAAFSPDGRWFAYSSGERQGDAWHIFVEPYPPTGAKYQLPAENSRNMVWSSDGKQVFYAEPRRAGFIGRLAVVDVRTQPSFGFGKPTPLPIDGAMVVANGTNYDVTRDGKRFVVVMPVGESAGAVKRTNGQINVVLNWFEELKSRVPN